MKFGILYQCITCQSFWWLDTGNKIMHYIENNRIHLLEKWNEKKFILPNKLLKIALQIGETPEPSYGRFLDRKIIPCAITTLDGKKYDKAILTITQLPPISEPNDKVFFVDEIKEIEPSEFSLPLSVRKKTAAAVEIRMGFSPTVVQSKCRQKFVLDGITNFFEQGKIKGKDIELLNRADHFLTADFQYSTEVKGIYYFYADTGNEPWNLSKCLKFSGHLRSYLGRIDI